jgi:hypothetical protein
MITALMMNAPLHQKTAKWPQAGPAYGFGVGVAGRLLFGAHASLDFNTQLQAWLGQTLECHH